MTLNQLTSPERSILGIVTCVGHSDGKKIGQIGTSCDVEKRREE